MTSIELNTTDWEQWAKIRKKMGYPLFYDHLFELERNKYNNYLKDYQSNDYYVSNLILLITSKNKFTQPIIEEIKQYICEKTGLNDKDDDKDDDKHDDKHDEKDIDRCFNVSKEQLINIDDYDTEDKIYQKLLQIVKDTNDKRDDDKLYLIYKSIEFGVKLATITSDEKLKKFKTIILKKIKEFYNAPEMACVKYKLKEYYKLLTGSNISNSCADWSIDHIDILEFLYFNKTPSFIVKNLYKTSPKYYNDILTLDDQKYKYTYFVWRREGDPNTKRADKMEIITKQNFKNYSRFQRAGWSVKQLRTFFAINILPIVLQKCNIKINVELPGYKNIIKKALNKVELNKLIDKYIQSDTIDIDIDKISKIQTKINNSDSLENRSLKLFAKKIGIDGPLYTFIAKLMIQRSLIQRSLQEKILKIRERVEQKQHQYKYKWQSMCAKLESWDLEELRELAVIENINNYQMKSKRELCKDFEEILQRKIAEQRRNRIRYIPEPEPPHDKQSNELFKRHIQNNLTVAEKKHKQRYPEQYSKKCQNTDSLLGDDINDIKPEFFFTYKHNNKIFCDDIRTLYNQIMKGDSRNPYDRTPLSQQLINSIIVTYENLKDTMISLKDEDVEEKSLSLQDVLISKTTDLSGLLFHHAPIENFININDIIFSEFLMYLEDDNIISEREVKHILDLPDLQSQKIALVDLLIMRIRNDPDIVDGYSSIASNITDIYNSVFSEEQQVENNNSTISESITNESDNLVLQRKAMIFISKLTNIRGVNHSSIIESNETKISDFIRNLVEKNVLDTDTLYQWSIEGLISEDGIIIPRHLTKLKIKLLQYLIEITQPETVREISNSVNSIFS
jgi:hypothetical protein